MLNNPLQKFCQANLQPLKFFLTLLHNWYKIFHRLQERPLIKRGAEGANSEKIGTKLSGKRTVTYLNPGKIQPRARVEGLGTEGEKSRVCRGIISQVKRQEEGEMNEIVFLLLFWGNLRRMASHEEEKTSQ
jgi:hypothetical protein